MSRSAVWRVVLAEALALVLPAGRGLAQPPAAPPDLRGVEQFQARFNQDAGTPRLVLLLSPT